MPERTYRKRMPERTYRKHVQPIRTLPASCTAASGFVGGFCNGEVPEDSPVSLCSIHLTKAYRYCEGLIDNARGRRTSWSDAFTHPHLAKEIADSVPLNRVVYYAKIGDHIKIGTTGNVAKRMKELKADCLLASEPGSYDLERHRHAQFAQHHLPSYGRRSEFFDPGDGLLDHIASLNQSQSQQQAA